MFLVLFSMLQQDPYLVLLLFISLAKTDNENDILIFKINKLNSK